MALTHLRLQTSEPNLDRDEQFESDRDQAHAALDDLLDTIQGAYARDGSLDLNTHWCEMKRTFAMAALMTNLEGLRLYYADQQ